MFDCPVIVGVGPGLSSALARSFAREGCPIALCSRSMENLAPVKETIKKANGKADCYVVDTTDEQQVTISD